MANGKEDMVKLEPADFWQSSFDPSIEGVDPIVQGGTEIPADKEEDVRKAARDAGVRIRRRKTAKKQR